MKNLIHAFHTLSVLLLTGCSAEFTPAPAPDPPDAAPTDAKSDAQCAGQGFPCGTECCSGLTCAFDAYGQVCVLIQDVGTCCAVNQKPPVPVDAGYVGGYCEVDGQTGGVVQCKVK